jgi:Glycosyltransferase family 87
MTSASAQCLRGREVTAVVSARDRLSKAMDRWTGRPALFAIAIMNLITGLGMGVGIAGANFGADSSLYRQCAVLLAEGQTQFCGFLYSPLMALAAQPLTWISSTAAIVLMSLIGGAILLIGVTLETRGQALPDRALIGIAVFTFAPVVYELLLGQTTLLIAATLYPIARREDGVRNGIPFGVALALAPKPLLLPVIVWMFVWRRRALTATVLTALILTGIGIAVLGFDQYRSWLMVLTGAGRESASGTFVLSGDAVGNRSLWPLSPLTFVVACVVLVVTIWAIVRDSARGFVASLFAGLLLAPYSLLYAFSILLLAVKPGLQFAPRTVGALALTANLARYVPATLIIWSLVGLSRCLSIGGRSIRGMLLRDDPP